MPNNYSYLVVRPPPKVKTQILKATSAISYQLSAISYQLSAYRLGPMRRSHSVAFGQSLCHASWLLNKIS